VKHGLVYSKNSLDFFVEYNSASRDWSNLREEFRNDAKMISNNYGPVYVGFSSGIDSQIIARSFLDQKLDAEFVFLHYPGYNDIEYNRVKECESTFNFSVNVLKLNIDNLKEEWVARSLTETPKLMHQYTFEWLSNQLPEPWPFITQGSSEPAIIGTNKENVSVYHNYYDAMEQRFKLMSQFRKVIDFPYSPESISSYYTDPALKTFCSTISYFSANNKTEQLQLFNTYAKAHVKGKYFSDLIWYSKLSGYEMFPNWVVSELNPSTRVSVPYWELVEFLETTRNKIKKFNSWNFK
jgi:hypothetical protein